MLGRSTSRLCTSSNLTLPGICSSLASTSPATLSIWLALAQTHVRRLRGKQGVRLSARATRYARDLSTRPSR
ncbi:hypothetical protein PsYK624_127020 [Phanerochaete sordida]|uniref:Uncharacterized protein n=1 Tax=Phanerochaete sordida TaxID=48140 RepID=A0A9P3LIM2_9APHY|nr:hypothetical protein PsYK624_127020 [Phanerochaete sordida]